MSPITKKKRIYTYKDMLDKSREGIRAEVSKGLGDVAFYYQTVLGFPLELIGRKMSDKCT